MNAWLASTWAEVPVDPSPDQAVRWLQDELSKPEYETTPSLWERVLIWLWEHLSSLPEGDLTPVTALLIGLGAAALIVVISLLVAGPIRRRATSGGARPGVLADETRPASALRADAEAWAARGDWRSACLMRFRAIARTLETHAILSADPGRTAQEIAADAGPHLPWLADGLRVGAAVFDHLAYGRASGSADLYRQLVDLDQAVEVARPTAAGHPVGTDHLGAAVGHQSGTDHPTSAIGHPAGNDHLATAIGHRTGAIGYPTDAVGLPGDNTAHPGVDPAGGPS